MDSGFRRNDEAESDALPKSSNRRESLSAADAVMWALERNWEMVESAIEGLDNKTMDSRPADHCNSISWILWHMNRVVDVFINTRLQFKTQLWVSHGWYQKFGMEKQAKVMGRSEGEIVTWVAPPLEAQLGYFEAVKAAARDYINSLSAEDLDRRVTFPPEAQTQDHSLATALGQLVWDNVAHGGQIAYLRGLYNGLGWHR